MQHSFREFLRHGGHGQYVVTRHNGVVFGRHAAVSVKSLFPGYADVRSEFSDQLDRVIAENTRMLLNALTPPDTAPWATEPDLRDVSDAKEEVLRQWDERLAVIYDEYQTHPQRLRPLRTSMEERLLRAFAGQAHNCRCYAEPIGVGAPNDATLIEYVPTDGGYPLQDLLEHEAMGGHTVALHVGKSEEFLLRAVSVDQFHSWLFSTYRKRQGSFRSLQAAQRLTNSNSFPKRRHRKQSSNRTKNTRLHNQRIFFGDRHRGISNRTTRVCAGCDPADIWRRYGYRACCS